MSTGYTSFTKLLIKQVAGKSAGRAIKVNNFNDFIRVWGKLHPLEKDAVRKEIKKSTREIQRIEKMVREKLIKKELGKALSSNEQNLIDMYEDFFINDENVERLDVNSGWLIGAEYFPKTKTVFTKMKNGRILYPFFGVPKTQWIRLCLIGGDKMGNDFGRKYSANPSHWIRK